MTGAVAKIIWLVELLRDIKIDIITPVKLRCDNKAAIQIAYNPIFHERTNHIEIDCHFIREKKHTRVNVYQVHSYTRSTS